MCVQIPRLSACSSPPFCRYSLKLGLDPQNLVTIPTCSLDGASTHSSRISSLAQLPFIALSHSAALPPRAFTICSSALLADHLTHLHMPVLPLSGGCQWGVCGASLSRGHYSTGLSWAWALALWVLNRDFPKILRNNEGHHLPRGLPNGEEQSQVMS